MAYTPVPEHYDEAPGWTAQFVNKYIRDNFAAGVPDIFVAKGDLAAATGANAAARVAVGANGTILTAASGQAAGVSWQQDPVKDAAQAVGDIFVGSGVDTVQRVPIWPTDPAGYNVNYMDGNILYADSSAGGVKWSYPYQAVDYTSTQSQSITGYTGPYKVTNFTHVHFTLGGGASTTNDRFTALSSGKYIVVAYLYMYDNSDHNAGRGYVLWLFKNGAQHQVLDANYLTATPGTRAWPYILNGTTVVHLDTGDYLELYIYRDVGATHTGCYINVSQLYLTQYWAIHKLVAP